MKRWPALAAALAAVALLAQASVAAGDTASARPELTAQPVAYVPGASRYNEGYDHRPESYADRERRLAYAQYKEQERHAARERYLARERRLAERRLTRERSLAVYHRDAHRWSYRDHRLVYERGRPSSRRPPASW